MINNIYFQLKQAAEPELGRTPISTSSASPAPAERLEAPRRPIHPSWFSVSQRRDTLL